MGGPRWSPEEDRVVDWHWGEERFAVTAARVGRTQGAVRARLLDRGDSSAVTLSSCDGARGRKTVQQVATETGYDWSQVHRAMVGTGIRPVRTSDTPHARRHLLNEEQVESVVDYLGEETADACDESRSVGSCAHEARRSLRTAYAWVVRLKLVLLPQRRGLLLPDATLLVCTLQAAPSQPPEGTALTVRAIAAEAGVTRRWAYVLANQLGLVAGADARLSPADALVLRSRLEVASNVRNAH